MRVPNSQACQICVFIVFLAWTTPCHGSRYYPRSVEYSNSTSSSSSPSIKSSSSSDLGSKTSSGSTTIKLLTESVIPLVKSTLSSSLTKSSSTSLSSHHTTSSSSLSKHSSSSLSTSSYHTTSSHNATGISNGQHATITPAPTYNPWVKPWAIQSWGTTWPWGNQKVVNNTCSQTTDTAHPYGDCDVFAGTMHLSYFPPNSGNFTYPTTHWAPELSTTMTSPSIYMVVNSVSASNECGQLGPTYKSVVIAVHPSALSTIPPYANAAATTRIGPTRVLTLSDIASGCPDNQGRVITGEYVVTHPVGGQSARCNPQVVWPTQLLPMGGPFWQGCWKKNHVYGIYDPPGSVPPVSGLFTTTANPQPSNGPIQPAPAPTSTPIAPQQSTALTKVATPMPAPSPADTQVAAPPPQAPASGQPVAPPVASSAAPAVTPPVAPAPAPSSDSGPLFINIEPSGIQIIGTDSSSTYFAVPTDAPQQPPQSPDPVDSVPAGTTTNPVAAPIAPSGVPPVGQTAPGVAAPVSPAIPGVASIPVSQTIQGVPAALPSSIIIAGQTASLGSGPITIDSSVLQLTPSGIVVHDQAGGPANTIAIPTEVAGQPQASPVVATIGNQVITVAPITVTSTQTNVAQVNPVAGQPVPIATIGGKVISAVPGVPAAIATVGGEVISALPGASAVVIKGQTATIGGAPVTIADSNIVATLGPSGLIVQYPGGAVSTHALPLAGAKATLVSSPAGVPVTVGGQVLSVAPGASSLIFGTQTLKIGGPAMTIAGNNVVSLSPAGLIVQLPGGGVKTLTLPSGSYSAVATADPSSTNAVGGIIASIMGVPSPAPPASSNPSIPTSTASIVASKLLNGTAASTDIQSSLKGGAATSATGTAATSLGVAPGSKGTKLSIRCTSIIPWLGAVVVFGIMW